MGLGRQDEPPCEQETVQRQQLASTTIRSPVWGLTVIEGPDAGASITVDLSVAGPFLVGQSPVCQLRLHDRQVSRRHAALELVGPRLRLRDLGSSNGTVVSGLQVLDAFVDDGDMLRIGETTIRIERREDSADIPVNLATEFGRVVGSSPEMRRLYPVFSRLAQANLPVLIEGETGTGKEVLAESIHQQGPRGEGPFVVFDCTAVPASLMEAALFGHERGAFTGAVSTRRGVFEQAHNGTLFIDEIGDLEYPLQAKLLRAIERSEIQRVGGDRWMRVDVRIISATRRDLDREVQAGRFRDDLFFRLAVARVELPPLHKRSGDVGVLARHFWKKLGGNPSQFPYEALAPLEDYNWPGNVRELHNAIIRRLALGEFPQLLPPAAQQPQDALATDLIDQVLAEKLPLPRARARVVEEFERRYVERVVADHNGSIARAAEASGIALRYFQLIRARHAK